MSTSASSGPSSGAPGLLGRIVSIQPGEGRLTPALRRGEGEEGAHRRQFPRRAVVAEPAAAAHAEIGAQVRGAERCQSGVIHRAAEMAAEEADQPMRRRDIGAHRMLGTAALAGQMIVPARGDRGGGVECGV